MPTDFLFWNEVVIPLAGMAVGVILGLPIIKAIVRRIEQKPSGEFGAAEAAALRVEVSELRRRFDAIEDVTGRLSDMEERLEFAERLLTRQRESGHLPS
ncbi:MAG TPA: hypothetical protein VF970_06515 [Gemmatimonadales bacterium]